MPETNKVQISSLRMEEFEDQTGGIGGGAGSFIDRKNKSIIRSTAGA